MTAKELRQAAKCYMSYNATIDGKVLAEHILSTVRDDDGELASSDWQFQVLHKSTANFGMCRVVYAIWCQVSKSGSQTRGQFRSLCVGLGIVLEDKEKC